MRYAFSTLACPSWSTEQIVEAAARFGYDGIELRLLDGDVLDPVADRKKVVQAVMLCRTRGIAVCALDTSCKFNLADETERRRQLEELLCWIALAQEVDVPLLRVFGGAGDIGTPVETANAWMADALRRTAPVAERAGVTVALETHDAFSSARRVAAVLNAVVSPHIAALWDSHHPYRMGESAQEVAALLGARIAHVHVKDARRLEPGDDEWQLVLIGEGQVPVREQLRALADLGYTGWVSVEWEKKWHPEIADPGIALPQHITWLREAEG